MPWLQTAMEQFALGETAPGDRLGGAEQETRRGSSPRCVIHARCQPCATHKLVEMQKFCQFASKKKIKKAQLGEVAKVPQNEMYLTEQEVWRSQALKCPKCLVVLQTSAGHFPEAGLQESSA